MLRAGGVAEATARAVVAAVNGLRKLPLVKAPGIAEAVDWARAAQLLEGGAGDWPLALKRSIGQVLKDEEDLELVADQPRRPPRGRDAVMASPCPPPAGRSSISAGCCTTTVFRSPPSRPSRFLKSIALLGPQAIGDVYWAARATLAPSPDRLAEFDALFDAVFRGATGSIPVADPGADEETTVERSRIPVMSIRTSLQRRNESGSTPTGAEALIAEALSPQRSASERLRTMQRTLADRAPHRRGYRHIAVNAGRRPRSSPQPVAHGARRGRRRDACMDEAPGRSSAACCSSSTFPAR